jgi:hypothetical protein
MGGFQTCRRVQYEFRMENDESFHRVPALRVNCLQQFVTNLLVWLVRNDIAVRA